eukprot:2283079-Pyramimonas_sp.AAC.1
MAKVENVTLFRDDTVNTLGQYLAVASWDAERQFTDDEVANAPSQAVELCWAARKKLRKHQGYVRSLRRNEAIAHRLSVYGALCWKALGSGGHSQADGRLEDDEARELIARGPPDLQPSALLERLRIIRKPMSRDADDYEEPPLTTLLKAEASESIVSGAAVRWKATYGKPLSPVNAKWDFADLGLWTDDLHSSSVVLIEDCAMAMYFRLMLERYEHTRGQTRQQALWEESVEGAFWRVLAAVGPGFKNATWAAKMTHVVEPVFEHGQDLMIAQDVLEASKLNDMLEDEWMVSAEACYKVDSRRSIRARRVGDLVLLSFPPVSRRYGFM